MKIWATRDKVKFRAIFHKGSPTLVIYYFNTHAHTHTHLLTTEIICVYIQIIEISEPVCLRCNNLHLNVLFLEHFVWGLT